MGKSIKPSPLTEEAAALPISALRAALAGFFSLALAMGIGRFFYTPVLPAMLEAGRLNPVEAGWAAGANFLGYLLGALAASSPIFGPHRYRWLILALCLCVLTTYASGLWFGLVPFAIIRFLAGIASAFSLIFVSTIVMALFQQADRQDLISVHFAGVGFGISLSALLVSLANAASLPWTMMWFWAAGIALGLIILISFFLPGKAAAIARQLEMSNADKISLEKTGIRHFGNAFWLMLAGYGFFGFGYSVSATFINTIAKADINLAPAEPWVWLAVGVAGIPSIWLWNTIAGRIGLAFAYSIACLIEALGILLLLLVPIPAILMVSGITLGGTFMAVTALGLAKARSMARGHPATALGLMTASFGLGQMLGPILAGQLYQATQAFVIALVLAMVGLFLTIVLTLLSNRIEDRHHPQA